MTGKEETALTATLETAENEVSYWAGQMAMNILRIGRALKVIRDGELFREGGYDSFAAYLDARAFKGWTIGQTQGYKYVKVFERYGSRLESLGCSNLEVLYLLKDAPEEDIEKLSESGELSNMTVADARDYKKELEAANEQISLLSGDNEQKSAELESEKQAADRLSKDLRAAKKELEALRRERDELKDRPIEVAQPSDEDIEKIRADARAEIKKEYEQQTADRLKAAAAAEKARYDEESAKLRDTLDKLTAEKSASDDRIKELEQSLQSTEKSSDKPAVDENLIEFKFYFAETQENLKKFLAVIDKVEDTGQREKFKGAAKKFISAILNDLGG